MASITVALIGSKTDPFRDNELFGSEAETGRDWSDREKVELDVSDDETLSAILSRAGTQLGVAAHDGKATAPAPMFFAQYAEEAERQFARLSATVDLVDEEGRVRWGVMYDCVTYGELVRANDAKAMGGDPARLYYCTYPGVGNGVLITLAQYALALYGVIEVISTLEGAVSLEERVRAHLTGRLERGAEALDAHGFTWEQRNADPDAINSMLGQRPWHPADVAGLLGCTEDEAGAVLWAFGFAESADGLWRRGADEAARVLDTLLDEFQLAYALGHDDFQQTVASRVRHQLTTGTRAPQPFVDRDEYGDGLAVADEPDLVADAYDDEELDESSERTLPLDHLRLGCACGKEGCTAVASFGIANGRLKIGFVGSTDHFVLGADFAMEVAAQVSFEIDEAKLGEAGA
jgi:hypothetical protein